MFRFNHAPTFQQRRCWQALEAVPLFPAREEAVSCMTNTRVPHIDIQAHAIHMHTCTGTATHDREKETGETKDAWEEQERQ